MQRRRQRHRRRPGECGGSARSRRRADGEVRDRRSRRDGWSAALVTLEPIGDLGRKGRRRDCRGLSGACRSSACRRARRTRSSAATTSCARLAAATTPRWRRQRARARGRARLAGAGQVAAACRTWRRVGEDARRDQRRLLQRASATLRAVGGRACASSLGLDDRATAEAVRVGDRPLVPAGDAGPRSHRRSRASSRCSPARRLRRRRRSSWCAGCSAALGAERPVVLVLDDLHWAEPLLLDLTEHLVEWSRDVPLLVLAAARPELRDVRVSLATPGRLVARRRGAGRSRRQRRRRGSRPMWSVPRSCRPAWRATCWQRARATHCSSASSCACWSMTARCEREGDRWVAAVDLARLELPPTIHALLVGAHRTARARGSHRARTRRGRGPALLARARSPQLLPRELRAGLDAQLESLRRSELIEPDAAWFLGEPVLRFHHVLIRDAAYQRLLKEHARRAARAVRRLDRRAGRRRRRARRAARSAPRQAHHDTCRGSARSTTQGRALGERAARHLAARRPARARARRRRRRREPAGPRRSLPRCRRRRRAPTSRSTGARRCSRAGDVDPRRARVRASSARFDRRLRRACAPGTPASPASTRCSPTRRRCAPTADAVAGGSGRARGRGRRRGRGQGALRARARRSSRLGQIGLRRPRSTGRWPRRGAWAIGGVPTRARGRAGRGAVGSEPGARARAAAASTSCACCASRRARRRSRPWRCAARRCSKRCAAAPTPHARCSRRRGVQSRSSASRTGFSRSTCSPASSSCSPAIPRRRSRCLRAAYEGLRDRGLGIDAAQAAALLARALLAQGRVEEADALSHESEALAGDDLQAAIAWRCVRAEALAAARRARGRGRARPRRGRARRRDRRAARPRRRPPRARRRVARRRPHQ